MDNALLAAADLDYFVYALPLVIAISLVYAATRHELFAPILAHAVRVAVWIVGFMLVVLVVLSLLSWWA